MNNLYIILNFKVEIIGDDFIDDIVKMLIKANEPLIGIGLAAKKLGVSPELLRLYEKEGLLFIYKTKSGHRLFSEKDLSGFNASANK